MYKYLILTCFLLTGCLEADIGVDPVDVNVPDLPCIDGWQFDYLGQPIVDPNTGAQLTCV